LKLRLLTHLLVLLSLVMISACGDDDPVSPPAALLPDLTDATTAEVTVYVRAVTILDGQVVLSWREYGVAATPGTFAADTLTFSGAEEVRTDYSVVVRTVDLEFDSVSGDLTNLSTSYLSSNPSGNSDGEVQAHDIPLSSFTEADGQWEAVWQLSGPFVCMALDSITYQTTRPPESVATWTCAGEEEALIVVRLSN